MAGREVESRHQLLGHRPAGELPGDVTVRPRAGELRVDIGLRALLERAAAFGQPLQECRATDQPAFARPSSPRFSGACWRRAISSKLAALLVLTLLAAASQLSAANAPAAAAQTASMVIATQLSKVMILEG